MKQEDYTAFANRMAKKSRASFEVLRPCPLCGSMLKRGETVHTVVYSGSGKDNGTAAENGPDSADIPERSVPAEASNRADLGSDYEVSKKKSSKWARHQDSLVYMYGCRHCYPPSSAVPRSCPVCGAEVPQDGYVIARMFERQGRKHVHVLGCTQCRGPGSRGK